MIDAAMVLVAIAGTLCFFAAIPAGMFLNNLRWYRAPGGGAAGDARVAVLIPARNEERNIGACVESVLASRGVGLEVLVLDDASTDSTAEIVREIALRDGKVRLVEGRALPAGWNGKQHACWSLAHTARHDLFCFVDADVRLEPEALARMAAFLESKQSPLVSGFPRQVTETWMEWLLLPRLFRQHGMRTDLADLTGLARCRMYRNARQVWQGLAKNATEGIASPVRILPISLLLALGQIVPYLLAVALLAGRVVKPEVVVFVVVAVAGAWLPRVLAAIRYRQDWRGALLHPLGIAVLLAIQWYSLTRKLTGGAVSWKDRAYAGE